MMANENRILIVALLLMLAFWFGFSLLFPPEPQMEKTAKAPQQQESLQPQETVAPTHHSEQPLPAGPSELSQAVSVVEGPVRDIVVETDFYRAVFTSSGARLT